MERVVKPNPIPQFIENEFKGEHDPYQVNCKHCGKIIFYGIGASKAERRVMHHFKFVHPEITINTEK